MVNPIVPELEIARWLKMREQGRRKPVALQHDFMIPLLEAYKYSNRRLYCPLLGGYISLAIVGQYWDKGVPIRIRMYTDPTVDITVSVLLEMITKRVMSGEMTITQEQLRELTRR